MKRATALARVAVVAAAAVAVVATKPERRRPPLQERNVRTAPSSSISMMRRQRTRQGRKPLQVWRQVQQRPRHMPQRARRFLRLPLPHPHLLSKRLDPRQCLP
jgi:hypothetical protein